MNPVQRVSAVVAALLMASVLAACAPPENPRPSEPTREDVPAELEPFYGQVLTWSPCADGQECATATAPLDWDAPADGRTVELALTRTLADDGDRIGSLFTNPGGPGASGVDFVQGSPEFFSDDLRDAFDIIGWDPRGVGASTAVECYTDPADFDEFLFGEPVGDPGSAEYAASVTASAASFAAACAENSGDLLGYIGTASTVRDLDLLRALVGDTDLNYFGLSYGTDIGAQYAEAFPDRVGRMVLDGATDPETSRLDVQLAQTEAFGNALRAYLADCIAGTECPFAGETVDGALERISALLDRLSASPVRIADGRLVNAAYLSTAINAALYDEGSWPYLSIAFAELGQGVGTTTALLADSYVGRETDGTYPGNFFTAFIAISCIDAPVERDPAVLEAQREALAAVDPLGDLDDYDALGDVVCGSWPVAFDGETPDIDAAGAPPILVVATTGDPATPYEWGVALADQLSDGVLLTFEGEGHIAYDEGVACINDRVDAFLLADEVPADGQRCAA